MRGFRMWSAAVGVFASASLVLAGCAGGASPSASPSPSIEACPIPSPSASAVPSDCDSPAPSASAAPSPSSSSSASGIDLSAHSIDDPDSIWVVVNKLRPFSPKDWAPSDLTTPRVKGGNNRKMREVAADALDDMVDAAAEDGVSVRMVSGYRTYDYQVSLYQRYVNQDGKEEADTYSARPGYSEHQTGLAADLGQADGSCTLDQCFENTKAGEWLEEHSWEYGFVLRFPDGYEDVTGYTFEPWHFRYVGEDLAEYMHDEDIATIEQAFGLPDAADYAE